MDCPRKGHLRSSGTSYIHDGSDAMKLREIDRAVLAAHEAGKDWKSMRGIRSARRFGRVLARAKQRKAAQG